MRLLLIYACLGMSLLLVSILVVIGSLFAGRALPYTGELAYISTPGGINQLYVMDVQRQFIIHLKQTFVNDCCLTWSPDGRSLTYVVDMSSDGSTDIFSTNFHDPVQRLTRAPGADLYPAYSPDGRLIAYMGSGYGFTDSEIYLMNTDGSDQHALTTDKRITNINPHPVWSADGQSVLFSDFNNLDSLYAIPSDCIDPCDSAIHNTFGTNGLHLMITSFVMLDQSRLFLAAFERSKNGGYGMYSFDARTATPPVRLTINAGVGSPAMAVYDHWIAFESGTTDLQQRVDDASLYVLDDRCIGSTKGCVDSIQKVATELHPDDNLSWSADGRWLAYVTTKHYVSHLNLLDTTCIMEHLDCADYIHPLPITAARFIRPTWRPPIQ